MSQEEEETSKEIQMLSALSDHMALNGSTPSNMYDSHSNCGA